ncbi:MAG: TonB-dependent receptor, partial [Thermoanaerobaculia bacterium]|nr:TonB-dependent receptor [Thermoanaerobaculia bacterium]
MTNKKRFVQLLLAFYCLPVLAQTDTVLSLQEVTIRDNYFTKTGFASWRTDSIPVNGPLSVAERLLWENPLSVRATGAGTLTTVSARGAGPAHTPVYWQGLNLQNPMHGVVDVALLPLWPGDVLEVQYGGQSALQSSGAMGGAIHIKMAEPGDKPGWSGSMGAGRGSFGHWEGQGSAGLNWQQGVSSIRAAWQKADNDFPFRNTAQVGALTVRQTNSRGEKMDVQQFNRLVAGDKNSLETATWFQKAYREIPPAMTAASSDTWQRDQSLRAVAAWKYVPGKRHSWQNRVAWFDERIEFQSSGAVERSRSRTAMAASELFIAAGSRLTLKSVFNAWWQQAKADGYSDSSSWFQQRRLAGAAMAAYRGKTLQLTATLRQEWAENQAAPFTWSMGGQWFFSKQCTLRMHVSRNFNLPTFNDRFWRGLGNPDLKPERGHSADAGLHWQQGGFSTEITGFHILLDNWILWQPGPDGLFRPGNLRQVRSRGVETALSYVIRTWGSRWKISARHQFVRAINTAVYGT